MLEAAGTFLEADGKLMEADGRVLNGDSGLLDTSFQQRSLNKNCELVEMTVL